MKHLVLFKTVAVPKEFSVISFNAQQHSGRQAEIFSLLQLQIFFPFDWFCVDQKLRVKDKQAEEPITQGNKIISLI